MKALKIAVFFIALCVAIQCTKQDNSAPQVDLHTAVVIDDIAAIQQHVKIGSDLDVKEPTRGSTPLITAALLGKTDAALTLINGGADINIQNNEGSTALITAAFFCHTEIVKALLEKGADKSLTNNAGRNALDSVSRPFEDVKPLYDGLAAALAPLGLQLDYEHIKTTRPEIAEMLK